MQWQIINGWYCVTACADELEVSHAAGSNQLGVRQQTGSKNGNGYGGE